MSADNLSAEFCFVGNFVFVASSHEGVYDE